eukprot:g15285.t1
MSNFTANVWERGTDQNYRPCWINRQNGQVTYQLQDGNGIPLPQNYGGGYGMGMVAPQMGGYAYPMAMWGTVPAGRATRAIAVVGEPVKPDKWTEYEDKDGTKFYHNPSKPDETTWEKPEDYDKQENAGKPPPPTSPKKKNNNAKYTTERRGWL